jgi:hypothetical protein
LIEMAITATITVGIGGASYVALNPAGFQPRARTAADQATCRTVDSAIIGYLMNTGTVPTSIRQLAGYVRGDISGYRIVDGVAAGPGCARR